MWASANRMRCEAMSMGSRKVQTSKPIPRHKSDAILPQTHVSWCMIYWTDDRVSSHGLRRKNGNLSWLRLFFWASPVKNHPRVSGKRHAPPWPGPWGRCSEPPPARFLGKHGSRLRNLSPSTLGALKASEQMKGLALRMASRVSHALPCPIPSQPSSG